MVGGRCLRQTFLFGSKHRQDLWKTGELFFRRFRGLIGFQLIRFILISRELVGLVRRSVRWHREQALTKKEDAIELHGDRLAAIPPITLPESNDKLKVRFLDTSSIAGD